MGIIIRLVRSIGEMRRVGVIVLSLRIRGVGMGGGANGLRRIAGGYGGFLLGCRGFFVLSLYLNIFLISSSLL